MAAYFLAQNVNRKIAGLIFDPVGGLGGIMFGVYEAVDETEISTLRALASDPKNGVEEISKEIYDAKLKKKVPERPVIAPTSSAPMTQLKGEEPAVIVEDPVSDPIVDPNTPKTADALIEVAPVEPPPTETDPVPERPARKKK